MSETRDDKVASLFQTLGTDTPDSVRSRAHELAESFIATSSGLPLAPGDAAGPYEIVGVLGAGGQAVVYEARHATLGRRVALKVPRRDVGDRLVREAKLLATLEHPAILQVFDLSLEGPVPFLVLELCEGWSLEERLEVVAPDGLPLEQVHSIATSVLEALAYAHELGVIHRDVKPSNILFDKEHRVKVSDFGIGTIARADELSHSAELSQLSILAGTPLYVAPEQENPTLRVDGKLDGRADLFSFGKVLFQMLTGASPRTIRPASRLRPGLGVAWDELIFKLTEERPERRFRTARAALFELPPLPRGSAGTKSRSGSSPALVSSASGSSGAPREWIHSFRVEVELSRRLGLVVYRCRDEDRKKSVLVHMPAKNSAPEFVERFRKQAEAATSVTHPDVLRVTEVWTPEGESPFSVLEDFDGRAIAAGRLDWREALRIVTTVAHALRAVHESGIVLGDVSPRRILVDEGGAIRLVIDAPFEPGSAVSLLPDPDHDPFAAGAVRPAVEAMVLAPERHRGVPLDARSDVYSLGLTFYRFLTGQDPLAGARSVDLVSGAPYSRIMRPDFQSPDLPIDVVRVLGKMLEPERARRYASAEELIVELEALGADKPVSAGRPSLWPGLSIPGLLIPADAPRIGPCRIGRELELEGSTVVYEAFHEGQKRLVRLRVLAPDAGQNPRVRERFLREARQALAIQHPNVERMLEVGEAEDGRPYAVLEPAEGRPLPEILQERGRLPWREAAEIVRGAARGLAAAHGGVVHRDIKPESMSVALDGQVKVGGFGANRDMFTECKLTADGAMIGTPFYMAPEIVRGVASDGRADLYSLGVVFYELLTGVVPFGDCTSTLEVFKKKCAGEIEPPETRAPLLPLPVRRVLGKMLETDRDKRYATALALLEDLDALLLGRPVRAGEPSLWPRWRGPDVAPAPGERRRSPSRVLTLRRPGEARHMAKVVGFGVLVGVVGVAITALVLALLGL